MRNLKKTMFAILMATALIGGCTGVAAPTPDKTAGASAKQLKAYYIDVGQADACLLEYGGRFMLIDAGDNDDEGLMVQFLYDRGVKTLDYVVGTHPHADHIGGMDAVIKNFDVKQVYMPKVANNTETFLDVLKEVEQKGLTVTTPTVGKDILFADIPIKILGPSKTYEDINNNSIVLKLAYKNVSCLFTGDIEALAEADTLKTGDVSATVLKVAHHGSETSSTAEFIKAVNPKYAVISSGLNNTYGHPHAGTLKTLNDKSIAVYRTDKSGTVVMSTDGAKVEFSAIKKETKAVEKTAPDTLVIANINSKKYHLPSCSALPSEKNRVKFDTKEAAAAKGYTPCQNCYGK